MVFENPRRFEAEDFDWGRWFWHPDARLTALAEWREPGRFEGWEAIEHRHEPSGKTKTRGPWESSSVRPPVNA